MKKQNPKGGVIKGIWGRWVVFQGSGVWGKETKEKPAFSKEPEGSAAVLAWRVFRVLAQYGN